MLPPLRRELTSTEPSFLLAGPDNAMSTTCAAGLGSWELAAADDPCADLCVGGLSAASVSVQIEGEFPQILPIRQSLIKYVFEPAAAKVLLLPHVLLGRMRDTILCLPSDRIGLQLCFTCRPCFTDAEPVPLQAASRFVDVLAEGGGQGGCPGDAWPLKRICLTVPELN